MKYRSNEQGISRALRVASLIALFPIVLLGCASPGADPGAALWEGKAKAVGARAVVRSRFAVLGPDERRVAVVVLPGDAQVEVDGQPVRRRDGVVELVGKVGAVRRLRVSKGTQHREETTVKILEGGASPAVVNLDDPPLTVAREKGPAKRKPVTFMDSY